MYVHTMLNEIFAKRLFAIEGEVIESSKNDYYYYILHTYLFCFYNSQCSFNENE